MAAGIIFGPNTPGISLVDHPEDIELLAALGLVLLLFHLGLEFSLDDLASGGRKLVIAGATYLSLNLGGGLAFGFALGWGTREALVIAGAIGISSSAIVTKLLVELRRLANPETRLILGIIVVEDLFLALYLAVLQPVLSGSSGWHAVRDVLVAFLFVLVIVRDRAEGARSRRTAHREPRRRAVDHRLLGRCDPDRGRGRGARCVRRDRRVPRGHRHRRDSRREPSRAARAPSARCICRQCSSSRSASRSTPATR